MKKSLVFVGGFVAGAIVTFVIVLIIGMASSKDDGLPGLTLLEEKGDCIPGREIEVIQVIKPNMALAYCGEFLDHVVVLLVSYDGDMYYDNQKIKLKDGQCARQIGYYQYTTKTEIPRNVPAVVIE